jgi:Carboxypeptidase regulatory-like domain/TonB-dependent Receptor Plug Domain
MLNKQIFCTALAMLFVLCIKAQSFGEIHGKVLDSLGKPIPGILVVANNGADFVGDQSDENGKFRLKPLKPGSYSVVIENMFYDTIRMTDIWVVAEKTIFLDPFELREVGVTTGITVITYTKKHMDPLEGTINSLSGEELANNAAFRGGNVNALLISMTPEIKSSPNGEELYFRGSRAGSVIYFIDGVKYTGNNVSIPSSGVNSVSVYTGGLPAKYGDTTGGVVVIETKNYLQDYYKKLNQ